MQELDLPKKIKLGVKSLDKLGELAKDLNVSHLFVVIDHFLTKEPLNYDKKIENICRQNSIQTTFFSGCQGEPTTDHLESAIKIIEGSGVNGVVSIGGGSAIDLAKAISVFAKNRDISLEQIPYKKRLFRLPLIAIPTTAGTGSETTKIMVINDVLSNVKKNPSHADLIPDIAILDPELTTSLPKNFTAYTGLDALAHAIEAYVSNRASILSDHFAIEAIKKIGRSLPVVFNDGKDIDARQEVLLASCYAGIAFSNSSTNLCHATARPLGARFNIPHGLSVALLHPFVIEFGIEECKERYAHIGRVLSGNLSMDEEDAVEELIRNIGEMNRVFGIWSDGANFIDPQALLENIDILVEDALSGNGILTNRKVPQAGDIKIIFEKLADQISNVLTAQ